MEAKIIILSIVIDWIFKAVFCEWLYPWIDAKLYGGIYEKKIQNITPPSPPFGKGGEQSPHWFWRWLFKERDVKIFGYVFKNAVPRYRVFQKLVLVIYWGLAYYFFYSELPWYAQVIMLFGVVWAYYWMKMERRYYYWNNQEQLMYEYERERQNVYWLSRIYFSGYWLFKGGYNFRGWVFDASSLTGTAGLYAAGILAGLILKLI